MSPNFRCFLKDTLLAVSAKRHFATMTDELPVYHEDLGACVKPAIRIQLFSREGGLRVERMPKDDCVLTFGTSRYNMDSYASSLRDAIEITPGIHG